MPPLTRDEAVGAYRRLFNAGEFFEAHEVLEDFWQEYGGEDRTFYQGLIQVAVALEHARRGNRRGARGVLGSARTRLDAYLPAYDGFDLAGLLAAAGESIERGTRPPLLPAPPD